MRFLVDAQLPPTLIGWLRDRGHGADHVEDVGLLGADDQLIWTHALSEGYALITKDRDFSEWSAARRPAPQIVWLRFGNARKRQLLDRMAKAWPLVLSSLDAAAGVVEVR